MNQEQYLEQFRIERAIRKFKDFANLYNSPAVRSSLIRDLSRVIGPKQTVLEVQAFVSWWSHDYFHDLPEKEADPAPVSTLAAFELSKLINRLEEIEKQLETALPAHVDALSMFSESCYVQMFDSVAYLPLNQLRDEIKDRVYQFMEEITTAKNLWFWMRNEAAQNSTEQVFIRAHRYALKIRVIISYLKLSLFEVSI